MNISYEHVDTEESNCSLERFNNLYFNKHKPVLIKGGCKHWPAVTKWNIDYLTNMVGQRTLELREKDDINIIDYDGEVPEAKELASYFQELKNDNGSGEIKYARQSRLLIDVTLLQKDIEKPVFVQEPAEDVIAPYIPENHMANPMAWFGPKGTYSDIHWDMEHNIFAQVKGSKRFILISPDDSINAYPSMYTLDQIAESAMAKEHYSELAGELKDILSELREKEGDITRERFHDELRNVLDDEQLYALCDIILQLHNYDVNAENPDYSKHPDFDKAKPLEAIVEAGDLLYVPLKWRHCVRSLSTSFSMNWFFLPSINERVNPRYIILQSTLSHLLPR